MHSFTILLSTAFLALLLPIDDGKKAPAKERVPKGESQSEMNMEAAGDFKTADAALNKIYQKVLAKLDEEGKEKLKAAQRAWVQFRDAHSQFEADQARGGSMAPMLYDGSRATLTNLRIKDLQRILKDYDR